MNKKNQQSQIIQFIEDNGSITGLEATTLLHIMDYRKRISEIRRAGIYVISDKWEKGAEGVRYKRYFIEEVRKNDQNIRQI